MEDKSQELIFLLSIPQTGKQGCHSLQKHFR